MRTIIMIMRAPVAMLALALAACGSMEADEHGEQTRQAMANRADAREAVADNMPAADNAANTWAVGMSDVDAAATALANDGMKARAAAMRGSVAVGGEGIGGSGANADAPTSAD